MMDKDRDNHSKSKIILLPFAVFYVRLRPRLVTAAFCRIGRGLMHIGTCSVHLCYDVPNNYSLLYKCAILPYNRFIRLMGVWVYLHHLIKQKTMRKRLLGTAFLFLCANGMPFSSYAAAWKQFTGHGTYAIQYVGEEAHVKDCYLANPLVSGEKDWAPIKMNAAYDYVASAWNINDEGGGYMSVRNTQGGTNDGDVIIFASQIRLSTSANFTTYKNNQTFKIWYDEEAQSGDGTLLCSVLSNYEANRYWVPSATSPTLSYRTSTMENSALFKLIPLYYHAEMVNWLHRADSLLQDVEKTYPAALRTALLQERENINGMIPALDNTEAEAGAAVEAMRQAFEAYRAAGTTEAVTDLSQLTPEERVGKVTLTVSGTMSEADFRIIRDEMYNLRELDLSAVTLAALPDHAFSGHAALQKVVLPATCTRIGKAAFLSCASLTDIALPAGLTEIGDMAFARSGLTEISIGANVSKMGDFVFDGCLALRHITVDASNNRYCTEEDVLYNKEKTELVKCAPLKAGELKLPEGLRRIAPYACTGCTALTGTLVLPATVDFIGNYAFDYCPGLKGKLVIPSAVKHIGNGAFWGCEGIEDTLALPAQMDYLGERSFGYLNKINRIDLPENLAVLKKSAFQNCTKVKQITSPALQVPGVESFALYGIDRVHTFVNVPEEALPAYRAAEVWSEFQNYDAVFEGYDRLEESGSYYIQYVGEGVNKNKFLTFNPSSAAKATFAALNEASVWDLDFFEVTSATSAVTGGKGTDIRFVQDGKYKHINMNGECWTDAMSGYKTNDNRTFAFWLKEKSGELKDKTVAIQGNKTFWNASAETASLTVESRSGDATEKDFVFRVIEESRIDDAFRIELLKQTISTDALRAWLEGIRIGDETWALPESQKGLKDAMLAALDACDALKESTETDYNAFMALFDKTQKDVEEAKAALEAALSRPQAYEMPVGLCLQLVRSTDNRTLMRGASTQWKQYCTSFDDAGTVINVGANENGVPEEVTVEPAVFVNKWDSENQNYYLHETVAGNALRLNDGFLSKSKPGSTDYMSKARIAAYHIATDSLINVQGADGGFTAGKYFSPELNMEADERTATVWKMNILKRIIENGECPEALADTWIPVEMMEGAQMGAAEGHTYDWIYWHKTQEAGKWYAVSLKGETTLHAAADKEFGQPLEMDKDFTLLALVNKQFVKVSLADAGGTVIPAGTYVVRMNASGEFVYRMSRAAFAAQPDEESHLELTGTNTAENRGQMDVYTVNAEGTAFVYGTSKTVAPFEGYITYQGNPDEAGDIAIREGVITHIGQLAAGVSVCIRNHRVSVSGTDDWQLYHISGMAISDKAGVQKPGNYILTIQGKSQTITL